MARFFLCCVLYKDKNSLTDNIFKKNKAKQNSKGHWFGGGCNKI
ncbi:hypothetical protein SAMN04490355_108115 [Pelosinus propionicus DSM 13327]|uniref:Uncharacterized protein n=1 Tax=Pelosinus propionicus DSM 13327 TaxID=1123291 RepID=A0A1I4Q2L1_9FIRM|nr:hypothetical protein SAMN04490355_108115 [Pelosinus propionicus DSM 13327]